MIGLQTSSSSGKLSLLSSEIQSKTTPKYKTKDIKITTREERKKEKMLKQTY